MMPLPTPNTDENRSDFMDRCMSNDKIQEEFPTQEQQVAVCSDQFKKHSQKNRAFLIDDIQGINLPPSHVKRILQGEQDLVVMGEFRRSITNTPALLMSQGRAYGIIQLSTPQKVGKKDFKKLQDRHYLSEKERELLFPSKPQVYVYQVSVSEIYDEPKEAKVPKGLNSIYVKDVQMEMSETEESARHTEYASIDDDSSITVEKVPDGDFVRVHKYDNGDVTITSGDESVDVSDKLREDLQSLSESEYVVEGWIRNGGMYLSDILIHGEDLSEDSWRERREHLKELHYPSTIKPNPSFVVADPHELNTSIQLMSALPGSEGCLVKELTEAHPSSGGNKWAVKR